MIAAIGSLWLATGLASGLATGALPTPAAPPGPASSGVPFPMALSPVPRLPPDPPENLRDTAKIDLGRLLFFDPILSSAKTVACATCHHPNWGWADGRALPIGVGGSGLGPTRIFDSPNSFPILERNTPALLGVAFNGWVTGRSVPPHSTPMFWDSRVQGLESQVFIPLRTFGEMRGDGCREDQALAEVIQRLSAIPEYRQQFAAVFGASGGSPLNATHLAQAIAAFERTLIPGPSPIDRFLNGEPSALNSQQRTGMQVFEKAGCQHCHGGPMFSDFKLHVIGVKEEGTVGREAFRTPSLRNLRDTAPYMHNGSLRTIRDVLKFYDELAETVSETLSGEPTPISPPLDDLLKHLNLNPEDFEALEAFLDALNSEDYDRTIPNSVPSGLPVPR